MGARAEKVEPASGVPLPDHYGAEPQSLVSQEQSALQRLLPGSATVWGPGAG